MSGKIDTKAIMARADAATPGPWLFDTYNHILDKDGRKILAIEDHPHDGEFLPEQISERSAWYTESKNTIQFCASAREDIPSLCRAYDEQAKEIERLRGLLKEAHDSLEHAQSYIELTVDEEQGEEAAEARYDLQKSRTLSAKLAKELRS